MSDPVGGEVGRADDSADRLDSWKEIAAYLGRTERTVRRWEGTLGLPVHRLAHEKRSSVYAFRSELKTWLESRQPQLDADAPTDSAEDTPAASSGEALPSVAAAVHVPDAALATPSSAARPRVRTALVLAAAAALAIIAASWVAYRSHAAPSRIGSIAVLPFDNLSPDPDQAWLSDATTELLTTELSKIRSLKVISRTSARRFGGTSKTIAEIGNELGVDGVVEGSATRAGDRIRITAQLISTATDTHLWARDFEGDIRGVLGLQRDVARAIAGEVGAELTSGDRQRLGGSRPRVDPQAMADYLSGVSLYRRNQLKEAVNQGREAIRIDPSFAAGYELVGVALELMGDYHQKAYAEILPDAQAALQRAIDLDPERANAIGWLGATYFFGSHDWARAETYMRRAFELDPSTAANLALLLAAQGRYDEATAAVDRALQRDPFNVDLLSDSGRVYEFARRYDESARLYQKAWDLNPGGGYAHYFLPIALILGGHPDQAFEHFYLTPSGQGPLGKGPEFRRLYQEKGWPAVWQAWLDGRPPGALDDFSRWARIMLHKDAETLDMLERLEQLNDSWMVQLEDPVYDHLRHEPRFQAILRRVGYPQNMIQ